MSNKETHMNIPQVQLLKGSHAETGQTGQGCFMNVIAYLNGEPTITDQSDCVCFVMRPLAIWANDWMTDAERPQLLPFILRAMGSRTEDKAEISRRLALVVAFAEQMAKSAEYAAKSAEYAAKSAKYAAEYAAKYAEYAAKYAAEYAKYAEYAEYAAVRKKIIADVLELFDGCFPPLQAIDAQTVKRVRQLESLAA